MPTELDKFFEGLPSGEEPVREEETPKPGEKQTPEEGEPSSPEEGGEGHQTDIRKNRRERRLEDRLRRTEEMNIALADRIKTMSEASQFKSEFKPSDDVPAEWIALYGESPEAKRAWQMNQTLIERAKEDAKREALEEFNSIQTRALEEQRQFENLIDSELESIEDDFNVDLTSNSPAARKARREFLELVQRISPKDEEGNITSYADFGEAFEIYHKSKAASKPETPSRAKELASRNMGGSGNAPDQPVIDGPINFRTARQAISKLIR